MAAVMTPRLTVLLPVALLASVPATGRSEAPTLAEVLARAGDYVSQFHRRLTGLVAEEFYVQRVTGERPPRAGGSPTPRYRETRSDLLLLRTASDTGWVQFRDVFEVDGRPVRDRSERVARLLQSETGAAQANRIRSESARYNIGNVVRTINVPVLPLQVLVPRNQARFEFERAEKHERREQTAAGLPPSSHFTVRTEVWVIRFEEVRGRTLIREVVRNADVFSKGRLWIEPSTGRVLMSELVADTGEVRAQINVSYQSEPLLGLLVPVEMHETYSQGRRPFLEAKATYGRFRQADTDEPSQW